MHLMLRRGLCLLSLPPFTPDCHLILSFSIAVITHTVGFPSQAFAEITSLIQEFVCESTIHEKSTKTRRLQECFAIQPGVCGLLDVARKAFLQSVEDIYELGANYAKTYGFEELKVAYNARRGYFLTFPSTTTALPPIFIQASVMKKSLQCSTEEVKSLR